MKKFQGLILALVVSLPLVANARIARDDLEAVIPVVSDAIGRLRACSKFDQEGTRYDTAARDTELALYRYIRASDLVEDSYPDVVAKKAWADLYMEHSRLLLSKKTNPEEIEEACNAAEVQGRQHIVTLLKAIQAHNKGRKK